jgi:hypothetical protein
MTNHCLHRVVLKFLSFEYEIPNAVLLIIMAVPQLRQVSCHLTVEAWVRVQGGICGGQSDMVTGFSRSSVFLCQYSSTAPYSLMISSGGWTVGPLAAAIPQRHSLSPAQQYQLSLVNNDADHHPQGRPKDLFWSYRNLHRSSSHLLKRPMS